MGFFDALRKVAQGKPVFDAQQSNDEPQQAEAPPQQEQPQERPVAAVERVECRPSGPNMQVSVSIQNNSQQNIMLDKILLMGTHHELDTNLAPGQEREFVNVYSGPRPNHRSYNRAELHYHDETGDYFSALHTVEFRQEQDGTYELERFRLQLPIKDI